MQTIKLLKQLLKHKKITKQAYKTYRGQCLSGDEQGCLVGLRRKKLI